MRREPKVETVAHIIADSDGRPQLHSLRSNPAKAWEALFGRTMLPAEREAWKRKGFRVIMVQVENFHSGRVV